MLPLTLPFDSPVATLENSGGKALNLVRLTRAGFPVPPGVVLTTQAYRAFVAANDLEPVIADYVDGLDAGDPHALAAVSTALRAAFRAGQLTPALEAELHRVASGWAHIPLAVRSSATAEDLPELSFAGQQDTYLNVIGADALIRAVVDCWSSLWTARALGYRARNGIDQRRIALAVVVQQLVPAQASGVLFTANPLTGVRGETVIDATFGLGEALVSGQVEPDHYVVDSRSGRVLSSALGAKTVRTEPSADGGVDTLAGAASREWALTEAQVAQLTRLGQRVQAHFATPQDLEWAVADGRIHLLQSRPITSLFPLPAAPSHTPAVWFSFGAFQGMLEPFTPLGQDAIKRMLAGAAGVVGVKQDPASLTFLQVAGDRFWVRVDPVLRHRVGSKVAHHFLPLVEPSSATILAELVKDSRFAPAATRPSPRQLDPVARFARIVVPKLPQALADPVGRRHALENRLDGFLSATRIAFGRAGALASPSARLSARMEVALSALDRAFAILLPEFGPVMGPSLLMTARLTDLAHAVGPEGPSLVLAALRALPGNVTTEMDLTLWKTATTIRKDPYAHGVFADGNAGTLAEDYLAGRLPRVAQQALAGFLERYGMRGVGEIDLGTTRWRERPADVIRLLQTLVTIEDPAKAPDAVFAASERSAAEALARLLSLLAAHDRLGLTRRQVKFLVSRVRGMFGARETPKFTIIRLFGMIRAALLDSGRDLVDAGRLTAAEDVAFLHFTELQRLWTSPEDVQALVTERRTDYQREAGRRQLPLVMVSDGRTFYERISTTEGGIEGSPVSPGVAEGLVRVVFDPQSTSLEPGEILVCPGTDPAWTPLFLAAAGLVTEVGGMMTHGAVVAREYGIPAVVGVPRATTRLVTGQRIRLDGSSGVIEVLGSPLP